MNPNGSFMSWKEALHRDFPCGHRMEKKRRRFYAVDCTLSAYARYAALAPPVGRLVAHIAKKYYTQSDEQDDLISIGTIGLIKGVSSYRPEKGTRLATYAAKCVENEILMYFRSRKKLQGEVSLNDSLDSDADGESLYLMDVVGVEDTMYLDIQDRDDCLRVRKLVHECLTEREEEVITSRYGLGGRMPRTQREVAKKLGISRSYVSRIEKRALQKLEEALGERE